jgi:DNA polymerase III subunit chi
LTEVLFYHLTERPLEAALPEILEKALQRNWRVAVCGTAPDRLAMLDDHLWTFRDDSFLPHAMAGEGDDARQPVLLGTGGTWANDPQVLVLVDGARVEPAELAGVERVCLMFDGNDPDRLAEAREDWKRLTGAGLKAVYWAQEGGRWVKKAEAG